MGISLSLTCLIFKFPPNRIKQIMSDDTGETADVYCSIQHESRGGQRSVGACVRRRVARSHEEDTVQWALELYDFLDNEQYSNLDSFLVQVGACVAIVAEDTGENSKADSRKVNRILEGRPLTTLQVVKKQLFKRTDNSDVIRKLVGKDSHETNVAAVWTMTDLCTDRPLCLLLLTRRDVYVLSGGETSWLPVPELHQRLPKSRRH